VTAPPNKPLEQMTQEEVREWKDWLTADGRKPRPFVWGREFRTGEVQNGLGPVSESVYKYEPELNGVIERSADGKRYIVGVRNGELQRLHELTDAEKPGVLSGLRRLRSR
jgi:hypothetical protein